MYKLSPLKCTKLTCSHILDLFNNSIYFYFAIAMGNDSMQWNIHHSFNQMNILVLVEQREMKCTILPRRSFVFLVLFLKLISRSSNDDSVMRVSLKLSLEIKGKVKDITQPFISISFIISHWIVDLILMF